MLITILEGMFDPKDWEALRAKYRELGEKIPAQMVHTHLSQNNQEPTHWKLISVWRSREALMEYRKSVPVPEGLALFKGFGVEPIMSLYDIQEHKGF